ncbi:MAG: flagellar protein FlgN [Verrucomicrobia bacterium]|nr:flagellar protein FlgN [Verrucomicrobiota bacterium]
MKAELEDLISTLREELTQYGELLALLEQQQDLIVSRSAEGLLENLGAINAQVPVVAAARQHRDQLRKDLAAAMGQATTLSFQHLCKLVPQEYQPLLGALIEEINDLLLRSQQRLRQNHLLLSRSLDLMQQMISSLFPSSGGQTYNQMGAVKSAALPQSSLCEMIV